MAESLIQLGQYQYDTGKQRLLNADGQEQILRAQSLQVLQQLALNANQVVTKNELIRKVWPTIVVGDDSLVQCVADIRRILQDKKHKIVKTIPRRGYLLVANESIPNSPALNIPEDLLPFLGRRAELRALKALLSDPACRLLVLTGMGGIGKSRLARQLGRQFTTPFPQGVCLVELAPVSDPELIPAAIAAAAGFSLQGSRTPLEQLTTVLANRQILLILDNIEHLLPEGSICQALLEHSPHLKILVTSRQPLQLYGEWVFQLQGLALPEAGQEAARYAAFTLFVQSARRFMHDFIPTAADQAAIQAICRLVGGMPLGIEIAASWVPHLSCAEILLEMRRYLRVTPSETETSQTTGVPSLNNMLQQSWQMLSRREQQIMQTLALFRGTFTREAATKVTGMALTDYQGLLGKSMLSRTAEGCYSLHEVMRQYASERRTLSQQHAPAVERFLDYHLTIADAYDTGILGGQQLIRIRQLEDEHASFRECLRLCSPNKNQQAFRPELGLQLVGSLGMFWFLANHWKEGHRWANDFLHLNHNTSPSLPQAAALLAAGGMAVLLDQHTMAEKHLTLGTDMAAHFGKNSQTARGLAALGVLRRLQGRVSESITCSQQSMCLFETLGDEGGYQFNLGNLGHSLAVQGQDDAAITALEECIRLNQQIGTTMSLPYALVNLGRLHWKRQDAVSARAYLQQSIEVAGQLGIQLYRAQALRTLGWIDIAEGNTHQALSLLRDSAESYLRLGDQEGLADVLHGIGVAKTEQNELGQAWQFIVVAEELTRLWKVSTPTDNQALLAAAKYRIHQGLSPTERALQRNLGLARRVEEMVASL